MLREDYVGEGVGPGCAEVAGLGDVHELLAILYRYRVVISMQFRPGLTSGEGMRREVLHVGAPISPPL